MNVRPATAADREALHALYREFFGEVPPEPYEDLSLEEELGEVDEIVASGLAYVAEDGGELVGFALARRRRGGEGRLTDLYVRPSARRRGVGAGLVGATVAALRASGATHLTLWVDAVNRDARAVYRRWGFREEALRLGVALDALDARLGGVRPASYGSVHVQTDDVAAVERAVRQFVPRLPGDSRGSVVAPPRNGWIAVYDDACDRSPAALRRLAREVSDRLGGVVAALGVEEAAVVRYVLFERGRVVDEYLSVPEYHGPLPPGDVVALGANPTVAARLTGADPARLRAVARTAGSSADLPPPGDLLAEIGAALGLDGADHGFADAGEIEGAIRLDHG